MLDFTNYELNKTRNIQSVRTQLKDAFLRGFIKTQHCILWRLGVAAPSTAYVNANKVTTKETEYCKLIKMASSINQPINWSIN